MGDDLSRPERLAVRTPMQWSDGPNAGFSPADPKRFPAQVIADGPFGCRHVNAYAQSLRDASLLKKTSEMVRMRLSLREIGFGVCRPAQVDCKHVLALRHDAGSTVLMLANLSSDEVEVSVEDEDLHDLVDILDDGEYPPAQGRPLRMKLRGYGYRWMRRKEELFG